jgi:hypothetical protein
MAAQSYKLMFFSMGLGYLVTEGGQAICSDDLGHLRA